MTVSGPNHPARQGASAQSDLSAGADLHGGRDMRRGDRHGQDPRSDDRFAKALHKAMAGKVQTVDDLPEQGAVSWLPQGPAPLPVVTQDLPAKAAEPVRQAVQSVAERIERYIRGAETAGTLRKGEGMVVTLPPNATGVTQVTVRMQGDVLLVSVAMQAAVDGAAMQAQLALLGQALSQRNPRQTLRLVVDEGEQERVARGFDPLMPKGRVDEG